MDSVRGSGGGASSGFELPKELFKQFRQLSHDIRKEGKELTTCQTSNGPRRRGAPAADLIPPQLAKLNLTGAQLAALRRRGFVNHERRNGRTVCKLRLRVEGVQIVRFLGTDRQRAESLAAELRHWQSGRRLQLEAGQLRKTFAPCCGGRSGS